MFKRHKIKTLLSQLASAKEENSQSELIAQIYEHGKDAFPCVVEILQSKQLDPSKGKILLEKLYDNSLIDDLLSLTGDTYDVIRGLGKKLVLQKMDGTMVKKLIANLESPNTYLRMSATEMLSEIKNQSCVLDLVSLFNKSNADLKLNVITILGETGGNVAAKLLINALKSKEWRIRIRAVRCLAKMKSHKSVDPLINEVLCDKDPQVKKSALDALLEIGDKKAAPHVLALLKDDDLLIRQKAVDCINQLGNSEIIPQVLELMRDNDVNIRRCAVEIITKMKDPKTGEALVKAMKDADWWVRDLATDALAEIKGENTVKILIAMLNDSDENIRRCAVEFFNKVSDASAVEPLIGLLKDEDWWVREKAVSALGRLKDPRAIKPLAELTGDDETKWAVPGALGQIGGKEIIEPLVGFLSDDQKRVRIEAIRALSKLKSQETVSELKKTLEDPEKEVRLEATNALKNITGKVFQAKEGKPLDQQNARTISGAKVPEGSILSEAILVVDLRNSTAIANKYGDQFALNLTKILTNSVNPIAKRERMQFMKSTGDGFLITFAKIKNAVQFARALTKDIQKYNKTTEESAAIQLGFAINFGETRVDAKDDRLGVATNMTFRVEGVKGEDLIEIEGGIKKNEMPILDRILVTEYVAEEIEKIEGLKTKLLGLFELKGITGLHRVFELISD